MTRLGFYIIHNNRYKLVKTIEVPWDFNTNKPDNENIIVNKPIIGFNEYYEVDENGNIIENAEDVDDSTTESDERENEEVTTQNDEVDVNPDESESESKDPIPEPPQFSDWFYEYFYNTLINDRNFFNVFNTDRTYIIIPEEDIVNMGFMITYKGRTILNFEEHDYRNIINAMFPDIRKDMSTIPDDSFGGYYEDKDFSQEGDKKDPSFGGYDDDKDFFVNENKGIDTYPNMF